MLPNVIKILACKYFLYKLVTLIYESKAVVADTPQLSTFLLLYYKAPPPLITVAESTPTSSRKDCSRPTSQPQRAYGEGGSPRPIHKSASFTPETEYQKKLNSPAQVN